LSAPAPPSVKSFVAAQRRTGAQCTRYAVDPRGKRGLLGAGGATEAARGHVVILRSGAWLFRIYDSSNRASIDDQCGSVAYFEDLAGQMQKQLKYYNSPDGTNKFFKRVAIGVWAPNTGFPSTTDEAHCSDRNGIGDSDINVRKFADKYQFEGALSHEMGHAYVNWTRCFADDRFASAFAELFERQVSGNGSRWSATGKPWSKPWEPSPGRDENKDEQFANTFRYFLGADATRGKSGPPKDLVVPGFNDPAKNLHWGKQLKLLPELTGYWESHGLQSDLTWQGGTNGYWQFKNSAGTWMKQQDYYDWYEWRDRQWVRVYPRYHVE
jgi:hypothetical protein